MLDEWYEALVEFGIDLEAFRKEDSRIEDLCWARSVNDFGEDAWEDLRIDDLSWDKFLNSFKEVAWLEAMAPEETIHSSADFTPARTPGHYQDISSLKMRRPRAHAELD